MVQTSILTTPWSAFWFSSRYKLRPSFSVWEALPVSPRDSCTCSVRVSADTNHVCKLRFMWSIGATHQNLLQFKSPRLWGESPLKCWSSESWLFWSMSLFFPLKAPRIWQTNQGFSPKLSFSDRLAPLPASQPLLPLPRWKLTRIQQRFAFTWYDWFPHQNSPPAYHQFAWSWPAHHWPHVDMSKPQRTSVWWNEGFLLLGFWMFPFATSQIWSHGQIGTQTTGAIEDSSRTLATSPTHENPPKCMSFSITWH